MVNNPGDASAGPSPEEQKKMEAAYNQMKRKMVISEMGKAPSTRSWYFQEREVSVSQPLQPDRVYHSSTRSEVGLLDIDITGPNVPKMMGLSGRRLNVRAVDPPSTRPLR